ncbi:MAG: hypothetical protein AAFQ51_19470, partial [Pseudomonadota bacterium]
MGIVRCVETLGSDLFVHAEVDGAPTPVVLRPTPLEALGTTQNATILFDFDPNDMSLFGADGARLA